MKHFQFSVRDVGFGALLTVGLPYRKGRAHQHQGELEHGLRAEEPYAGGDIADIGRERGGWRGCVKAEEWAGASLGMVAGRVASAW